MIKYIIELLKSDKTTLKEQNNGGANKKSVDHRD